MPRRGHHGAAGIPLDRRHRRAAVELAGWRAAGAERAWFPPLKAKRKLFGGYGGYFAAIRPGDVLTRRRASATSTAPRRQRLARPC
jgi:hypothetical protein